MHQRCFDNHINPGTHFLFPPAPAHTGPVAFTDITGNNRDTYQRVHGAFHIPAREVGQHVTRKYTLACCVTSGCCFQSRDLSMALHRPMLLGQTEAKRLAGPTKLSSSGRFAMHILDLNEKQTGVASGQLGRGVKLGLLSADIARISYNVLYMQMQTDISALITII